MSEKLATLLSYHKPLDGAEMVRRVAQRIRRAQRRRLGFLMTGGGLALSGIVAATSQADLRQYRLFGVLFDWLTGIDFANPVVWGSAGLALCLLGMLLASRRTL
ncbi:MAG: hypothetical protein D6694_02625 [Gammaproteobacteria bacterium]|nr:MAG: hypothetical protein D6694_02625 [Gammaproteobacteria bacterium]